MSQLEGGLNRWTQHFILNGKDGVCAIHGPTPGGGGSAGRSGEGVDQTPKAAARFDAIEMPLIMADVVIINWGADQYACRIKA